MHTTITVHRDTVTITGNNTVYCAALGDYFDIAEHEPDEHGNDFTAVTKPHLRAVDDNELARALRATPPGPRLQEPSASVAITPVPTQLWQTVCPDELTKNFATLITVVVHNNTVYVLDFAGQPCCDAEPVLTEAEAHVAAHRALHTDRRNTRQP